MDIRLTRDMIARSRLIARGLGIRDVRRLTHAYGGTVRGWAKKSSPVVTVAGRRFEVHWYEHRGIGRFELKLKWMDA